MKLPRLAIEQHQFTLVMVLLLTLMGVVSFFTMPRSEDPQFDFPSALVVAVFPGANPDDMEQLVVDPLEEAINEIEDLKKIETTIRDGVATIFVEFLNGTDPDEAHSDVIEAVADARSDLPENLASLKVEKQSPTNVNILQLALTSETASYGRLRRQAERLETLMERVPGVKRVETWAYPDEEVRVSVNLERMRELGLGLGQVADAIRAGSANIPGGNFDAGGRRFNIRTSGDFESLDDVRRTVVAARSDRIVYLEDVAEVAYGYADETHRARHNGRRAVFVTAIQREGTNIFDVRDALFETADAFAERLPDGIALETVFDQSKSVSRRVSGFFTSLMQGVLLVGLVILFALGARASVIVILTVPVSIFVALGWLDFSGYGLQQMSIVGLVIALGLLVDNAIVVTENVDRFIKAGDDGRTAAIRGTTQVGWAIVSATVTTLLAFLPMVLLHTGVGDFIRSMPVTVIFTLTASLFVSLTLTPFLSSRFLRANAGSGRARTFLRGLFRGKKSGPSAPERRTPILQRLLDRLVAGPYRRTLRYTLARPALVLVTAVVVFAGSMALFPLVGVSLFPKAEKPQFLINVDLPEGASLDKTDAVARYVESVVAGHEAVTGYATNVGRGNPRVYYNNFPKNETPTHAQLLVDTNLEKAEEMTAFVGELRDRLDGYPGAEIEVKEFSQGPPVTAPIEIIIVGDELDVLRRLAAEVETILAETPGVTDLDNPSGRRKTDLKVTINRDKAGMLAIPLVEIDRTVRASMAGLPVANFRDREGEDYDIVVRLPVDGRPDVEDFDKISVAAMTGARAPLRQVARLTFEAGPTQIEHRNLARVASVTADVRDGANVAEVTERVIEKLDAMAWPPGYRYVVGGEYESREESFGGMGQALLAALLGIFGVLVLQFRSFSQPLIIFAAIPFAITGAVLALLLTGYTFSFTAFIGLTSLVGIVVNNSIILVDYANHLRRAEGRSVLDAVRMAGETRFTPIILTTLTTIGGLLPLTLRGSTMWSPLGWAIIGGLLVSTVLTLVVVPVLYKVLTPELETAQA